MVTLTVDRIMTFILLLPSDKTHLADMYSLHDFVRTFYLPRHNDELRDLESEQRPGRPPSRQLVQLRDRIATEEHEYKEGIEVPDLCNATNVELLRAWQGDPQALHCFRFVRISGTDRENCTVTQLGSHKLLQPK